MWNNFVSQVESVILKTSWKQNILTTQIWGLWRLHSWHSAYKRPSKLEREGKVFSYLLITSPCQKQLLVATSRKKSYILPSSVNSISSYCFCVLERLLLSFWFSYTYIHRIGKVVFLFLKLLVCTVNYLVSTVNCKLYGQLCTVNCMVNCVLSSVYCQL